MVLQDFFLLEAYIVNISAFMNQEATYPATVTLKQL